MEWTFLKTIFRVPITTEFEAIDPETISRQYWVLISGLKNAYQDLISAMEDCPADRPHLRCCEGL